MDTDGIRVRPTHSVDDNHDFFDNTYARQRETRPNFEYAAPNQSQGPQSSNQSGAQDQHRRRHYKPRKCRICFDIVHPSFVGTSENIPGMFQPRPQVVYESEDGGRLLSPCKCKGSNKYVHEGCLQQWRLQDPTSKRNYWQCPTCKFNYKLSRLGWGQFLGTKASQLALTFLILIVVVFLLGFVADPIIDMYYNPWSMVSFGLFGGRRDPYHAYRNYEKPTWSEHFMKGFAGLGLMSMVKMLLASPLQFFRVGFGGGGGGRRTGRDRMNDISWMVVLIGVATFLYATWKFVAVWSARILKNVGERVMDVQADDDEDSEADEE